MKTFETSLQEGRVGESRIATWLRSRGWHVVPVYEIEKHTGKGPRLFAPKKKLIAPDMLVFNAQKTLWIEAKHKEAFTWHRNTQAWVTGIDLYYYKDYLEIAESTPFPVWLLFLQRGGHAKDSPDTSPSGLYGGDLRELKQTEHHRFGNYGKGGMVYWSIDALRLLAALAELPA